MSRAWEGGTGAVGHPLGRTAQRVLHQAMLATGATAGVVVACTGAGVLALMAAAGYSEPSVRRWGGLEPTSRVPVCEAIRTGRTVVVGSPAELRRRHPGMVVFDEQHRAVVAYPLLDGPHVVGGVGLGFDAIAASGIPASADDGDGLAAARAVVPELLERVAQLQVALDTRVVVEQAKGVLAERHGISVDDAFALLRGTARSRAERVQDLAAAVVAGELDL